MNIIDHRTSESPAKFKVLAILDDTGEWNHSINFQGIATLEEHFTSETYSGSKVLSIARLSDDLIAVAWDDVEYDDYCHSIYKIEEV